MKKSRQHKATVAYRVCIGIQSLLLLTIALLCAIAAKGAPAAVSTDPASVTVFLGVDANEFAQQGNGRIERAVPHAAVATQP